MSARGVRATLTSITDANNHTTGFEYNARGWVTQTTFPSTLYETYGYDAVGNLTSKPDRKNQTIQYVCDTDFPGNSVAAGKPAPAETGITARSARQDNMARSQ